ncbi:MCAT [Symbiodinium natans]|uniref:MCAT protein n=1 Tax=Symbiodinium natans TaxID=878477 RepID=A0A812U7Y1_9DINO|nr:MCAT [Symbiodinium natans]
MEAGWDPFGDPADVDYPRVKTKAVVDETVLSEEVPLDPWNDVTFVSLVQEAAREVQEQKEAAMKLLAEQQAEAEQRQVEQEARRLKLEQQARELAKLSLPERRQKLKEREAYTEFAMEAIQQAPAFVAANAQRKARSRELADPELPEDADMALGKAAAEIAAAGMGVKINFKTRAQATCPMALLFPDQNSKSLKMLRGLQEFPGARRLRETARALLDFDPLEGPGFQGFYELLRGPEGWLEHTQYCQPVMYVTQLAAVEKLRDKRPAALERCKAVAGLSLGDFAALTFAGVWDFETGLRAVQLRGELMEAAMLDIPQTALAVAGLSQETVESLCSECRESGEVCDISQRLFADGFLCAGSEAAVERLLQRARSTKGCKQVQQVKLAGACHTPMMQEARTQLFEFLQSLAESLRPPRLDVYLSCGSKVKAGSSPDWATLLADQLTHPANWMDSVSAMLKDGLGEFYECGPLNQLKGIMKRIDPKAYKATISLDVYSEEWQMRPAGSLPPRWAPWPVKLGFAPGRVPEPPVLFLEPDARLSLLYSWMYSVT